LRGGLVQHASVAVVKSIVPVAGANLAHIEQVEPCMTALEAFLHDRSSATPVLIKAALIHVQFETVHSFLDGNGRLGRLLIVLLLHQGGLGNP
jgi:Fic family protein